MKADVKVDQRADGMVPLMVAMMAQNLECLMADSTVDYTVVELVDLLDRQWGVCLVGMVGL